MPEIRDAARGEAGTASLGRWCATALLTADPQRLDRTPAPVLIDEWQREPAVWDFVRRSVDRNPAPARFLLTGSATPHHRRHTPEPGASSNSGCDR